MLLACCSVAGSALAAAAPFTIRAPERAVTHDAKPPAFVCLFTDEQATVIAAASAAPAEIPYTLKTITREGWGPTNAGI